MASPRSRQQPPPLLQLPPPLLLLLLSVMVVALWAPTVHAQSPSPTPSPTVFGTGGTTPAPTYAPTLELTPAPTQYISMDDYGDLNTHYFARLTGTDCAEALAYGPESVANVTGAWLSTQDSSLPHRVWEQFTFSSRQDTDPTMKIVWTFAKLQSLAARFEDAVSAGVEVDWEVYLAPNPWRDTDPNATYSGTWWFSNSAGISASLFDSSGFGFSNDDGCWGPPTVDGGTVDGNGAGYISYGVCNYDSADSFTCNHVVQASSGIASAGTITHLFFNASVTPTTSPTPAPTPCVGLILDDDAVFTASFPMLFARLEGSVCAEALPYGMTVLNDTLTATSPYLSTANADVDHDMWIQEGDYEADGTLDIRILWYFDEGEKTLADRFLDATDRGVGVRWEVYLGANAENGTVPDEEVTGTWWFSNNALVTEATFTAVVEGSGFSADDGCWGPPTTDGGVVDGNSVNGVGFGVQNLNSGDAGCSSQYEHGVTVVVSSSAVTRMYMNLTTAEPLCATNWTYANGYCWRVYEDAAWRHAQSLCMHSKPKSYLAQFHSGCQWEAVDDSLIAAGIVTEGTMYRFGYRVSKKPHQWLYRRGDLNLATTQDEPWTSPEYNHGCGLIVAGSGWTHASCMDEYPVLCQYAANI